MGSEVRDVHRVSVSGEWHGGGVREVFLRFRVCTCGRRQTSRRTSRYGPGRPVCPGFRVSVVRPDPSQVPDPPVRLPRRPPTPHRRPTPSSSPEPRPSTWV